MDAQQALEKLKSGNQRFIAGAMTANVRFRDVGTGEQRPFAAILGCSDSRVPAEIIFDQGIGDLFVIRVAGNVVAPSGIGSIEFAAQRFGTRLVVVLGHSHCGAVKATLDQLEQPAPNLDCPNLNCIVERIRPAVEPVFDRSASDLLSAAVRANVAAGVTNLKRGSPLLENLVANDNLAIVGAEYSLASGKVTFFE